MKISDFFKKNTPDGCDTDTDIDIEIQEADTFENKNVSVKVSKDILAEITEYSKEDTSCERGGIFLGTLTETDTEYHILITDIIKAKYSVNKPASLTFTHKTWEYFYDEIDRNFEDRIIVGWFHSHPGYGVFLSGRDMFIQTNFFNLPYQTAYVTDPVNDTDGFFVWDKNKVRPADTKNIILTE